MYEIGTRVRVQVNVSYTCIGMICYIEKDSFNNIITIDILFESLKYKYMDIKNEAEGSYGIDKVSLLTENEHVVSKYIKNIYESTINYTDITNIIHNTNNINNIDFKNIQLENILNLLNSHILLYKTTGNILFSQYDYNSCITMYQQCIQNMNYISYKIYILDSNNVSGSDQKVKHEKSEQLVDSKSNSNLLNLNDQYSIGNCVLVRYKVNNQYVYRSGMISDITVINKSTSSNNSSTISTVTFEILLNRDINYNVHMHTHSNIEFEEDEDEYITISSDKYNHTTNKITDALIKIHSTVEMIRILSNSREYQYSSSHLDILDIQRACYLNLSRCFMKLGKYNGWASHYASLALILTYFKYEEVSSYESIDLQERLKQLIDCHYMRGKALLAGCRPSLASKEVRMIEYLAKSNNTLIAKATSLDTEILKYKKKLQKENRKLAKNIGTWVGKAMEINEQQRLEAGGIVNEDDIEF